MAAFTIGYRIFAALLFTLRLAWLIVIAPFALVREFILTIWRILRSYGALAPVIAFFSIYYVASLQITTHQNEVFQLIDQVWECDMWQFAYLFKQLWVLVEAAFDFLLPIYNPVVDYLRQCFYDMVSEIANIADPASFGGIWEAVNAVVDFVVHVINTTHSGEGVPETEVPFFTDPFWNHILDVLTCSINFLANLVQSQSELLFAQPCTSCATLSAEACTCIRTISSVFDFRSAVPAFADFFDGIVDYVCCFVDSLILLAQTIIQVPVQGVSWFFSQIRIIYDTYMNVCVRDLLRTFLGFHYGAESLTPMSDRFIEIIHCPNDAVLLGMELVADVGIVNITANPLIIENAINVPLINKTAVCLVLFWDFVVLGPVQNATNGGPLRPFVEDGVEAYRLWAVLVNKFVFGVFANGTSETLKACQDQFWDTTAYTLNFVLGIQTGWNTLPIFPQVVRYVVAVGRGITYFLLRWICLTLGLADPLNVTLIDRTTDLSDLLQIIFHGLFGESGEFFGGNSFTGAPVDVIFTRFANIFANTGSALFYIMRTLSFNTVQADVPVNLGLWSDILEDSVLMVTDDIWPESTANVASAFRCYGEAFADALMGLESTTGSAADIAAASIEVCSCYTGSLTNFSAGIPDLTDRVIGPYADFAQCGCENVVGIALRTARLELLAHDPVFCSQSLVVANGGNCTAAAAEPDVIRELFLCPCAAVGVFIEEQLPSGGAGAIMGPLADAVCTVFVDWGLIVRPILAGAAAQSAPEAASYFADTVSIFFTCLDDLLTLASGGSVTSFLQWFWEWSGLAYLFGLISCAFQPVINEGIQGYLFSNPADFTLNGTVPNCDFVNRIYDPYATCVQALPDQPSPLNPINPIATVFDQVFRAIVTRLEAMVCCMHDAWFDILFNSGAVFCSADCLVCAGSGVDLSDLPVDLGAFDSLLAVVPVGGYAPAVAASMQSILDTFFALFGATPIDVAASMTLTPYNPPVIAVTPIVIPAFDANPFCCVRGVIDCYASQNVDDPFTAIATFLGDMWDAIISSSCALVDILRVFRYAVDSIRSMLDTITSLLLISTSQTLDGALLVAGVIVDVTAELLEITDFLTELCLDLAGLVTDINSNFTLINTAFSQIEGAFSSIDISSISSAMGLLCTDVIGIINDFIVNIYNDAISNIRDQLTDVEAQILALFDLIPEIPSPTEIFNSIKGMIESLVIDIIDDAIDSLCDSIPGCRKREMSSRDDGGITLSEQYEEMIPGYNEYVQKKSDRFRASRSYDPIGPVLQRDGIKYAVGYEDSANRMLEMRRQNPNITLTAREMRDKRSHIVPGTVFLFEMYLCVTPAGLNCALWVDLNAYSAIPGFLAHSCVVPQAVAPFTGCTTWSVVRPSPINLKISTDLVCTAVVVGGCNVWNSFSDGVLYPHMDYWATGNNIAKIHCASPGPVGVYPGCEVWARWFPVNTQTLFQDGVCLSYDFAGVCPMNEWIQAGEIPVGIGEAFDLCREFQVSTINPLSQVVEYRCIAWDANRLWPINGYITGFWFCVDVKVGRCINYISVNGQPGAVAPRLACHEFVGATDDCDQWEWTTSALFQPSFPDYSYAGYVCRVNFAAGLCFGDWQELNSVNTLAPGTAVNFCAVTGVGATHYNCNGQTTILSKVSWWTEQLSVCDKPLFVPGTVGGVGCEHWLPVNDVIPLPSNVANVNDHIHCLVPSGAAEYAGCDIWQKQSKAISYPGAFMCLGYHDFPAPASECELRSWIPGNLLETTLGNTGQWCKGTDVTKTICTLLGNDPWPIPGASTIFYICASHTGRFCDEYLQTNGPVGTRRFICTQFDVGLVNCELWLITDSEIANGLPYPPNGPGGECLISLPPLNIPLALPNLPTISLPVMGACSNPPGKRSMDRRSSNVTVTNATLPVECLWLLDEELVHVPLDIAMINETMYAIGDCHFAMTPVVANSSNVNATIANGTQLMLTRRENVLLAAFILEAMAVAPRIQKAYYTPPAYVSIENVTVQPDSVYIGYNMYEALTGAYPVLRFLNTHDAARLVWRVALRLSIMRLNATMDLTQSVCTDVVSVASPVMMRLQYEDPNSPLSDEGWVVYAGCWRLWVITAGSRHTPLFSILETAYMNANIDSLTSVLEYAENVIEANTAKKRSSHTHIQLNTSRLYTESEAAMKEKNLARRAEYEKRRFSLKDHYKEVSAARLVKQYADNHNTGNKRNSGNTRYAPQRVSTPRYVLINNARARMERFSARYTRTLPPPRPARQVRTYRYTNTSTEIVYRGGGVDYLYRHDHYMRNDREHELYDMSSARVRLPETMPRLPNRTDVNGYIDRAVGVPGMMEEYTRRNISRHAVTIIRTVLNVARVKWTPNVRRAEREYERTIDPKMQKRSLHESITGFPLVVHSIDGTFNLNTWLIEWWDNLLYEADQLFDIPFGETWMSDQIARLVNLVQELLLWLIDLLSRVSNPLVCDGPSEYATWDVYRIKCVPNIPFDVLDPITALIDYVFQRQFFLFDSFVTVDAQGNSTSCTQPNEAPNSNCGVMDGGDRPLCPTCDWCVRSYQDCVTDVGFGDVGDVLAFSIAVIPRVLNILLHPIEEIGPYVSVNAVFVVSLIFPVVGTIVIMVVAVAILMFLPVASYFMPQLWLVASAMFLLTAVFTFPDLDFNATEFAIKITFGLHNSGVFNFILDDEWFTYTLTKLNRFNYPDPAHSIPAIDLGCFVLTNGALMGLWVISLALLVPLAIFGSGATARLLTRAWVVLSAMWSMLNSFIAAGAHDRVDEIEESVDSLERRLTERIEVIEDVQGGPPSQLMPTGEFGGGMGDIETGRLYHRTNTNRGLL